MSGPVLDEQLLLEREPIAFDEPRVKARFRGASVLVTGAAGSIGSRLVETFLSIGARLVVCVDHHEPSLFRLGRWLADQADTETFRLVLADARDSDRLGRLLEEHQVDAVYPLAAYKHAVSLSQENNDQVVAVNVLATLALADRAAAAGVRDFVFPSTDKAVRPPSIYGATKRLVELELSRRVDADGSRFRIVRLVNVFGTAGNMIENWSDQVSRGTPLSVRDDRMSRYCMTSREATWLLASAACLDGPGGVLMAPVGDPVPTVQIARRVGELLTGRCPDIRIVGALPGERLHEELLYSHERLEPSEIAGVLRVRSERPGEDPRPLIAALAAAVSVGDVPRVSELIGTIVEAAVPA